ncbi:hypothetical protein V7112_08720 [Bacillus sp. JJ1566]|uniref:hypothetical protein n=1 Tax=Bacillus sp. JJ1566 TaxID=3122961 RepID=UPI002FFE84A5
MIQITFSSSKFDQMRLTQARGHINIKPNGTPVFQFKNKEQFNKYVELGKKREVTA